MSNKAIPDPFHKRERAMTDKNTYPAKIAFLWCFLKSWLITNQSVDTTKVRIRAQMVMNFDTDSCLTIHKTKNTKNKK